MCTPDSTRTDVRVQRRSFGGVDCAWVCGVRAPCRRRGGTTGSRAQEFGDPRRGISHPTDLLAGDRLFRDPSLSSPATGVDEESASGYAVRRCENRLAIALIRGRSPTGRGHVGGEHVANPRPGAWGHVGDVWGHRGAVTLPHHCTVALGWVSGSPVVRRRGPRPSRFKVRAASRSRPTEEDRRLTLPVRQQIRRVQRQPEAPARRRRLSQQRIRPARNWARGSHPATLSRVFRR
jgi:hypothetical protein